MLTDVICSPSLPPPTLSFFLLSVFLSLFSLTFPLPLSLFLYSSYGLSGFFFYFPWFFLGFFLPLSFPLCLLLIFYLTMREKLHWERGLGYNVSRSCDVTILLPTTFHARSASSSRDHRHGAPSIPRDQREGPSAARVFCLLYRQQYLLVDILNFCHAFDHYYCCFSIENLPSKYCDTSSISPRICLPRELPKNLEYISGEWFECLAMACSPEWVSVTR